MYQFESGGVIKGGGGGGGAGIKIFFLLSFSEKDPDIETFCCGRM